MLCHNCEEFRQNLDFSRDQEIPLHNKFDTLVVGSKEGCSLCRIIEADLGRQKEIDQIGSDYGVVAKCVAHKGFIVSFPATGEEKSKSKPTNVDVKVVVEQLRVPHKIETVFDGLDRTDDTHTGSSNAFVKANAWLQECLENHPYCETPAALEVPLPTRVIDVLPIEGLDNVSLLETNGMKRGYIALSHCWGGSSHVRTTTDTLAAYKSKIDMSILPKTFSHAVQTTRQLGVRYLWIDSLCIVQDSATDWESEASQMGSYYKNALVTISAAHGSNSDAGLYVERDSLSTQPFRLSLNYGGPWQQPYVYARDTSFQLSRSSLGELKSPLPLYSRSWVLQEQLLAARTLTYGKFGTSWRCQTMRFDERAPLAMKIDDFLKDKPSNFATFRGDPREVETTMAEMQRNWIFPRRAPNAGQGDATRFQVFHKSERCSPSSDHFAEDWGRLVQDYTSRGMTRQTDKLIALSGIASIAASLKGVAYAAGIWNGSHDMLVQGLLWSASKRGTRLLDVAPSWSWASIECEVNWTGHLSVNFRRIAHIVSFACEGTAARSQGDITLRSHVRPGVVDGDGKARLNVQTKEESNGGRAESEAIFPHWKQGVVSLDEVLPPDTQLLYVGVATGKVNRTRPDNLIHALVLRHDDKEPGKYRRVGFSTWNEDFMKRPIETAVELDLMTITIH